MNRKTDSYLLPVRPRPIRGEATVGFLMRVAKANGYEKLRLLQKAVSTFDALCQGLSLSRAERNALWGPYPSYWGRSELSKGLTAADFNHRLIRWCPLCLREASYLRGQWMLKISCGCSQHSVWLYDQCPGCGTYQQLERADFEQCACGAWLAETQPIEIANKALVGVSQAIEASISGKAALTGFPSMSVQEWLKLIRYLGQFSETFQPVKPGKIADMHHLDTATALMMQMSWLLDRWPDNFHILLAAIQRKAEAKTSIRDAFGPLYHVLYTDLSGYCFQFLRDEFERYLYDHWTNVVCKRNRAFKPETVARHPRVTLKQAARKAGVAPSIVRHFIRAKLITGDQIDLPSGRAVRSVDKQSLAQIALLTKGGVTLGEAARLLALPEGRVRELIAHSILKPLVSRTHSNAAAWLIPKQHVQRLFYAGTESSHLPPTIMIRQLLKYWHLRNGELKALVMALSEKRLVPVASHSVPVALGNVLLEEKEARHWLQDSRFTAGSSISVDEASRRLGLKQQVVYDLVRLGLLLTVQDNLPGRRVTRVSLEAFQTTYISLAEYSRVLNRAPRWVLQTLSAKPISGPTIDGSRQYFFRRSDVYSEAFLVGDGNKSESILSN